MSGFLGTLTYFRAVALIPVLAY